jgi:hypothetical protein
MGWFTPQRHQLAGDGKHTIKMMMTWGWFIGLMLRHELPTFPGKCKHPIRCTETGRITMQVAW